MLIWQFLKGRIDDQVIMGAYIDLSIDNERGRELD